jgi:hypothetical protein
MGLSSKERDERLRAIAETCYSVSVSFLSLKAAVCRKYGVTSKTAEDYIVGLIDGKIIAHDLPGGPLRITALGERWLDGLPALDSPEIPDPPAVEIVVARPRTPPSPPPTGEGQG